MTETEEIEWVKALLNPIASRKRSSFDFSYWWMKGKIYTCNCSKQTMLKPSFELSHSDFPCHWSLRGQSP